MGYTPNRLSHYDIQYLDRRGGQHSINVGELPEDTDFYTADEMNVEEELRNPLLEPTDAFNKAAQLFLDMDAELDSVLALSPSIFDPTTQLAIQSSGPPSDHSSHSDPERGVTHEELELYNQGPDRYTPRTPTPVEFDAGEGPLPLEDDSSMDHQSTDTQLSSRPPHPEYP